MSGITSYQVANINSLVSRRIEAARVKFMQDNETLVARATKEVNKNPVVMQLQANLSEFRAIEERRAALKQEEEKLAKAAKKILKDHGLSYYMSYNDEYGKGTVQEGIDKIKKTAIEEELSRDPIISKKLKELNELQANLNDMLTLAVTQARLRLVVDMINEKLGVEPSQIEKELLK